MAGRKRKKSLPLLEWFPSPALAEERKKEARRRKARSKKAYQGARKLRASPDYEFARNRYRYEYKHLKRGEGSRDAHRYASKEFEKALYMPGLNRAIYEDSGKPRRKADMDSRYAEWDANRKRKDPKRVAAGKKAAATRKARGH